MNATRVKTGKPSFFREFLRDRNVAAVSPSSPHLMRRLLKRLDAMNAKLIVELGPGDGVALRSILPKLSADARYVAIERNPTFAAALRAGNADPRLTVVEGNAQDIDRHLGADAEQRVDAVIASIPFTYLKKPERERLVRKVKSVLAPGGAFIIFHQYSPLMVPYLAKEFDEVHVEFEPLNIFPCFLMKVVKRG